MEQEPQTMSEYKTQREKDWNAYRDIHGILDPGYLTRTDYMDKYDSDHATLIASITLRQNSQNEHSQNKQSENKQSENKSENQNDDVDVRDSDHKKNKHNRRRRNKRSKDKQNDNHNNESPNHEESVNTKKPSQRSAEKRDKDDGEKAKSGENEKSENDEKSKKNAEAETSKSQDKQASKAAKAESSNAKKNVASSESEELSAQSSTMLDNDQAEVSKKSLSAIINNNKKQNKHSKHDESDLSNLDKQLNDKSESSRSYLRAFPTEVKDYAIKKVGEMVRSKGFTGNLELINKLSKNQTNLLAIYIMSQMDDEYFNNCSNRTDISDQLIEAARAVRSVKKSQETAKKPPMARDAKRAKEYSRDTYYLVEEILRLLALQFGTTKMKFQAGETDVAEGSISEMNKINFNQDFVKSMMVALQQQTQADLEKARLRKGSNSISATSGYDELI